MTATYEARRIKRRATKAEMADRQDALLAICAAMQPMAAENKDLHDLVQLLNSGNPQKLCATAVRRRSWQQLAASCLERWTDLNPAEIDFLQNISRMLRRPTAARLQWLDDIASALEVAA